MAASGPESDRLSSRPLYLQVKERLVSRLIEGIWQPGQVIPSEMQLASELGVSQGTVRKALDAMTAENMLIRRQGRGTFVADLEESQILFRFFHLVPDSGDQVFPLSVVRSVHAGRASAAEATALAIPHGGAVWRIDRLRTLSDDPLLVETITLPAGRFPDFGDLDEVPNNAYALYSQRWGITIASASEQLRAIPAEREDAQALGCAPGAPLLEISRVARDLSLTPVELRVSRCRTDTAHYRNELR